MTTSERPPNEWADPIAAAVGVLVGLVAGDLGREHGLTRIASYAIGVAAVVVVYAVVCRLLGGRIRWLPRFR
jgi:hypothetical protein